MSMNLDYSGDNMGNYYKSKALTGSEKLWRQHTHEQGMVFIVKPIHGAQCTIPRQQHVTTP
jgi:hypothetical protein